MTMLTRVSGTHCDRLLHFASNVMRDAQRLVDQGTLSLDAFTHLRSAVGQMVFSESLGHFRAQLGVASQASHHEPSRVHAYARAWACTRDRSRWDVRTLQGGGEKGGASVGNADSGFGLPESGFPEIQSRDFRLL